MTNQTPIANIAPALARAQTKIGIADKNAINTEHKSRYADLASIISSCREALAEQEISILQPLNGSVIELLIGTVLMHSSGEFIETEFRVVPEAPNDTDAVSSLITKYRRYGLQSLLCIATADDDSAKPAKKPEKKEPIQEPGPVVETHDAEQPDEPTNKEPVTTVETSDEWREVVCHYGSDTSPAKGHKLGELAPEVLKFVQEKVLPALGKTKKDRALAAAIEESKKAESTPATATDTLPEPEKPVEQPPSAKEATPKEPESRTEPMEWRSIVAHNFKPKPTITLGEIADSELDAIAKGYDGVKILRGMKSEGIAKIQAKAQTVKDKVLVNAIIAANEELDMRDSLALRLGEIREDFNDQLVANEVFKDGETIATVPRAMLDYLNDNWSAVEASIKEAK